MFAEEASLATGLGESAMPKEPSLATSANEAVAIATVRTAAKIHFLNNIAMFLSSPLD